MSERKIKLSVNPHFTDKTPDHKKFYREGFINGEMTLEAIAEAIKSVLKKLGDRVSMRVFGLPWLAEIARD